MMQHHRQHIAVRSKTIQRNPERNINRDIETATRKIDRDRLQMLLIDIDRLERHNSLLHRQDHLLRLTIDLRIDRPQRLVPRHHISKRIGHRPRIHHTRQTHHERQIVSRSIDIESVEEPDPLLRSRQRHSLRTLPRHQRSATTRSDLLRKPRRKTHDSGCLEQHPHRHLGVERGSDAGDHLGGDEGVAAEFEEVVVETDTFDTEDLAERFGDGTLGGGARLTEDAGAAEDRFRQRLPVELAARVERQCVEHHERRRNHVRRQRPAGVVGQVGGVDRAAGSRDDVPDELVAGGGRHHEHDGLRDGGVREQYCFDLTELDALATELDLEVGAADVFEQTRAVGGGLPPHQVAGAVHPLTGRPEGVGEETVGGQVGTVEVPARELDTGEVELAGAAHRHGTQPPVEDVCATVPLRNADRDAVHVAGSGPVVGDGDRGLGGSVQIVEPGRAHPREVRGGLRRQGLTDDEDVPQRITRSGRRVRDEDGEHRRHEVGDRDAVLGDPVRNVYRVAVPVGRRDHEGRADAQGHEETPQRHVEGRRGLLQVHVGGRQTVLVVHPLDLVVDRHVAHGHALRPARRTGGEDDVGGRVRQDRPASFGVGERRRVEPRVVECVDVDRGDALGQRHIVARRGEHRRRVGGLEDVGGAIGRVVGVDRHPGAPRLDDRVHADDELERTADGQSDEGLGADTEVDQCPGETVHPRGELGVGQRFALEDQRGRVGRGRDPVVELREQVAALHGVVGAVPVADDPVEFGAARERDVPDGPAGVRTDETVEELDEPRVVGGGPVGSVEIRVRLEVDVGVVAAGVDVDAEILDQTGRQDVDPSHHVAESDLVVEQHDVDPRSEEGGLCSTRGGRGAVADDVLVPVALVAQRARDGSTRRRDEVVHGGLVGHAQPERDDVRDHAAGAAQQGGRASRDGQAQDDVGLPGHLGDVGRERRDDGGRQTRVLPLGQLLDATFGLVRQRRAVDAADRRGRRGAAGEARGLLDALDLLRPVLAVVGEPLRSAVLHLDVVDLAQIGRETRGRFDAVDRRRVELGDAGHEGRGGETVEREMVDAVVPEVTTVTDAQDRRGDQPVAEDVDGTAAVVAHPVEGGPTGIGLTPQVLVADGIVEGGIDELVGLGVDLDESEETRSHLAGGADARGVQQVEVEVAFEFDILSDVGRHRRVDVLREPHAQLGRGQREGPFRNTASHRVVVHRATDTQRVQSHASLFLVLPYGIAATISTAPYDRISSDRHFRKIPYSYVSPMG
ncbi:hypothetical protein RDE2_35650 [Rhodococcus sp. RDE2]|nr:hypothetical protein RDE2_35650 [Rhodococcus sp. RDE2]